MSKVEKLEIMEGEWSDIDLKSDEFEFPNCKLRFSFTPEYFHIKASVNDLHFKDGDRSWRYGDGFCINFITEIYPDNKPSEKFYAYGFSSMAGEKVITLINHNGVYSLRGEKDSNLTIQVDEENNSAFYDIKLPWKKLHPFQPLLQKTLGINIRYNSQNDDGSTKRIQMKPDDHFDSEGVLEKHYVPVELLQSENSSLQFAFELSTNLVLETVAYSETVIFSPKEQKAHVRILVKDPTHDIVEEAYKVVNLDKGINNIHQELKLPESTSIYKIDVFVDELELYNYEFYKLNPQDLIDLAQRIYSFDKAAESPLERSSYYGLEYKMEEIKEQIENFDSKESPTGIQQNIEFISELIPKCESKGHFYYDIEYIRTAFKSSDDETLQPYSLVFPKNFNTRLEYKLVIALHGSGVDEVGFSKFIAKNFREMGFSYILVAPRGRDLSDMYVGQTEKDVFEIVARVKEMFHISDTLIFGFSMGGYGVWRLTFLFPDSFDKAIIGSGIPYFHWSDNKPELDVRSLRNNAKHIKYLVLHGTEDRAVPFEPVKEFIDVLEEEEFNVTFEVFEGAGHGNYDPSETVVKWLKKNQ